MSFDYSTLVTDRSQADLGSLRSLLTKKLSDWTAAEKAEFALARNKGSYNYTDLNRVSAAMEDLKAIMNGYGYDVPGYERLVITRPRIRRLPDGYTEVEYIESSGTQYIDTGYKPNSNTRLTMKCDMPAQSSYPKAVFGGRDGATSSLNSFVVWAFSETYFRMDYGSATVNLTTSTIGSHLIDKNKNLNTIDGVSSNNSSATFQSSYNLCLFAMLDPDGVDSRMAAMKLYECCVYESDVLVRNFVPCKDESGNAGLYDLANDIFYKNVGADAFSSGEDIPYPPEKDPYLFDDSDVPTVSQMERYLANVQALKNAIPTPSNSSTVPLDMDGFTLNEANAIETILATIHTLLNNMAAAWFYCGDLYSGEV